MWGVSIETQHAERARELIDPLWVDGVRVFTGGKVDTGRSVIGVECATISRGRVGLYGGVTAVDDIMPPDGPSAEVARPGLITAVERVLSEARPMIHCGDARWWVIATGE